MTESAPAIVVIYDGGCGMCRALAVWLHRHDRHWRLDLRPLASVTEVRGRRFARADLEREMHVVDRRGTVQRGFNAWRAIAREVPLLRPAVPLLWLPGVSVVGDAVYRWVAGHRTQFSRWLRLERRRVVCTVAGSTGTCDRR